METLRGDGLPWGSSAVAGVSRSHRGPSSCPTPMTLPVPTPSCPGSPRGAPPTNCPRPLQAPWARQELGCRCAGTTEPLCVAGAILSDRQALRGPGSG